MQHTPRTIKLNLLDSCGAGYVAGPFLRAPESEHVTSTLVPGTTGNCDDVMIILSNIPHPVQCSYPNYHNIISY